MLKRTKRDPPKSPPWIPGRASCARPGGLKIHTFLNLHFYRYFLDFGSHSGSVLEHVSWFVHHFFEHRIRIDFLLIFDRFLGPLIMWKNDFNVILFAKNKKSQVPKFHRFVIDFGRRFGIILEAFSHKFPYFFYINFALKFECSFNGKWLPEWSGK